MNQLDLRHHERLNHPFSFHLDGHPVYVGNNFSLLGIGVKHKNCNATDFCFLNGEIVKNGTMQLEGETIHIAKLRVCWLEHDGISRIYGMKFESIVEPEHQKVLKVYKHIREGNIR